MNQIRALWALLILILGGMGALAWKINDKKVEAEQLLKKAKTEVLVAVTKNDREHELALAAQAAQHQAEMAKLNEDNDKKLDDLRKEQRTKMAQAYEQFSGILEGGKKTLDYLDLIEQKVKAGKAVSKGEAEKLAVIATGLTYLQRQYQKPFQEFGELQSYLERRANSSIETPNMHNAFWKRMFSRDFREKEREFYRTEGERRGFQEANDQFTAAYSAAQKKMAAVNIDGEKIITNLNNLILEKQADPQDLTEFFNQARKALSTHQKVLEYEPEAIKPLIQEPRP